MDPQSSKVDVSLHGQGPIELSKNCIRVRNIALSDEHAFFCCANAPQHEDSDDESEEDEARHPLIVHDRDPEQNLEALRNPDAYRQNLA